MLEITVFTDPLCCWSWAFEPQLQLLREHFGPHAIWIHRMGGLIPTWNTYHDEVNSVTRPAQMGPVWMHAGQLANRPIRHQLWMIDPPATSYAACIAVKSAQLQSDNMGVAMLNLLHQLCMTEGKNIAKKEVLFEASSRLAQTAPGFNEQLFAEDFDNGNGLEAFRADLNLVRLYNINRFPTLVVKSQDYKSILISGHRQYSAIIDAIKSMARV